MIGLEDLDAIKMQAQINAFKHMMESLKNIITKKNRRRDYDSDY